MSDKNYTGLVFHINRPLQARELEELQGNAASALRSVTDVLFSDGDISEGAACAVDAAGNCTVDAGRIYLDGMVRPVGAANLVVPVLGEASVGVYLQREVVTALQDPDLYDNEKDSPTRGQAGADRIRTTCTWGVPGSGQPGNFYPVWQIIDGVVTPREAAPQLNAITKAIERYDAESTGGGYYVIDGMEVTMLPNTEDGKQEYSISAGDVRVGGVVWRQPAALRLRFAAVPDVIQINREPHSSATVASQRIKFDRSPVLQPATVSIQRQRTVEVTHGPVVNSADVLPENSVVKINSVKQGATTYTKDVDYKLVAGQVDWSLPGAEVAPGSKYMVDFEYIATEPAQDQTPYDFEVTGAVPNSTILVDYQPALRRIDTIVIDAKGKLNVIKGVSSMWNPVEPVVPAGLLPLAKIWQSWDAMRSVIVGKVRTVGMDVLNGYQDQINRHTLEIAELRLALDVTGRFSGLGSGMFADPMLDDSMRDQGMPQTALVAGGALQLDEPVQALPVDDGAITHTMAHTLATLWAQAATSEATSIAAPAPAVPNPPPPVPMPAKVLLQPTVDRWVNEKQLAYPGKIYFNALGLVPGDQILQARDSAIDKFMQDFDLSKVNPADVYMRSIPVQFTIDGFAPGELLQALTFDGIPVQPLPLAGGNLAANAAGQVVGTFTVPEKLPAGKKTVTFKGNQGGSCVAAFTGQVQIKLGVYMEGSTLNGRMFGTEVITHVV
ncbi:DUF4815 domain-containing protein [Comamonas odontotermitis]|uniref:DUF4815 domain-containing protein n=1 Tax=Comamonas odontotermitis TaxID=379895 RepID=UPI00366EFF7D